MDFFDINVPVSGVFRVNVQADYVYFLEGENTTPGGDTGIILADQSGNRIPLKPGQAAKVKRSTFDTQCSITNRRGDGVITGTILAGDASDFQDNRISGTVDIAGTVKTQAVGFAYENARYASAHLAANAAEVVFTAAQNVNGAVLSLIQGNHVDGAGGLMALIAKAGAVAPANATDGDVLVVWPDGVVVPPVIGPIQVPAGRSVSFLSSSVETAGFRNLLYALL